MTAVDDIRALGGEIAALRVALSDEKADRSVDVEDLGWWRDRAHMAEQERDELGRRLRDSEVRRVELEGLYAREVAAAATARAAVEASRGNR